MNTVTIERAKLEQILEALESQHRDRLKYTLAKRSANATCAEFKVNTLSELIESGYMHGIGKQTESAITVAKQALEQPVQEPVAAKDWEGAEYWMPLAWELCADECGEEACTELIWEGGPIPEPWGDRWLKYEDEAKRLIALVQKHTTPPAPVPLTYGQINKLRQQYGVTSNGRGIKEFTYVVDFARAIEAAHGITEKGD
jgi:hypothetical protein